MIRFKTINVDGMEIEREFKTTEEIKKDWYSEDSTTLPANDDEVVFAEVNGEEIEAEVFEDIVDFLRIKELPYTTKFRSYEDACDYVRKHIAEDGWIFEQKCVCTGAGCHVDNMNRVTIVGYSWF